MGGDDDVDVPVGSLEAYLDIVGPQHQPPVARAAIGFGHATEIEANDEALRGHLRRIDLPAHSPNQHFGIEVVGTDQPLSPALAPDAHQLDDRPEILSGGSQPIEMAFTRGFRLNMHYAGPRELLETLGQNGPRYQRRGLEQLADGPGAEAKFPYDDRGPTVAKNFGRFGHGTELGVGGHGREPPGSRPTSFPVRRPPTSTFLVLERRCVVAKMNWITLEEGSHAIFSESCGFGLLAGPRPAVVC